MLAHELLNAWPRANWSGRKVLVAISGGADSVALLLALNELAEKGQLMAAHFNHGWRGSESDGDQFFVQQLCQQLGVPLVIRPNATCKGSASSTQVLSPTQPTAKSPLQSPPHSSTQPTAQPAAGPVPCADESNAPTEHAANQSDDKTCVEIAMHAKEQVQPESMRNVPSSFLNDSEERKKDEASARLARYAFFIEAAYEYGASYVVTGHTADDRAETLLHNLFRGAGLSGAASLRQFRKLDTDLVLVRPLLTKTRQEIELFLSKRAQAARTDSSNADIQYARNFLRREVLPLIRTRYTDASQSLVSFSELVEEALGDIELLAQIWREDVDREMGGRRDRIAELANSWPSSQFFILPIDQLAKVPWTVQRAALRQIWLERCWPMQAMNRASWRALRAVLSGLVMDSRSPVQRSQDRALRRAGGVSPRCLAILPGAVRVEVADGLVAIGCDTDSM